MGRYILKYLALQSKILIEILWQERSRWILWLPVFYGCGIGIYFLLPEEPQFLPVLSAAITLCSVAAWHYMRGRRVLAFAVVPFCLVVTGITGAAWRTMQVDAPILLQTLSPRMIEGTVEDITFRPGSMRLTFAEPIIEHLSEDATPHRITVSLRNNAPEWLERGDRVSVYAGLYPPPKPVIPGGFQFHRHFFFQGIGATAYAIGKDGVTLKQKHTVGTTPLQHYIKALRSNISLWLITEMGAVEGAVASALITGEASAIPDHVRETMQQAGLAHVLSISGMHMALVAGICFFSIRLLLACFPSIAVRIHVKKWAAVIALSGVFAYLLLSGAPIPAQRAFVMAGLVLLAVMLDRSVTPMRSLALAAMFLLLVMPEALLSPSFQLSFAATIGILAWYERWLVQRKPPPEEENIYKRKLWRFWSGTLSTSGVATLATAAFVLHHFDNFPVYSLLGNVLALPVVSFWIMPVIVGVLVLLPFSLAGWLLPLLKLGIAIMIWLADWVASLPFATVSLPPLTTPALSVATIGGLWLCLWQMRWRHMGWVPVTLALASMFFYQPPDVVISADGRKIALRTEEGEAVMLRGNRSGFTQDQWRRFLRVQEFERKKPDAETRCDAIGCIYRKMGQKIAFTFDRSALADDCALSSLVVTPEWSVYHQKPHICNGVMVRDRRFIAHSYGLALWLTEKGYRWKTVRETLGNRPWSGIN